MGQKEVKNENCCGVFEMRDFERFFSEVLNLMLPIISSEQNEYPQDVPFLGLIPLIPGVFISP